MDNMDQNLEPKIEPDNKINKKNIITIAIVGVIVILVLLGVWYWLAQRQSVTPETIPTPVPQAPAPQVPVAPKEDSVSSINQELNTIDTDNIDQEFQAIDADINSL
jgi:flagellar basal body-associated protein FliL